MTEPALKQARELALRFAYTASIRLGPQKAATETMTNEIAAVLDAWAQEARLEEMRALDKFWDRDGVDSGDAWNYMLERIAALEQRTGEQVKK